MTTRNRKKSAGKSVDSKAQPNAERAKPAFISRYLGIDTHLAERNGSTEQVYGIAGERPAGRKLAEDIAKLCNQLDAEGYDVISVFPLTSGRAVEASVEATIAIPGRTYAYGDDGKPHADTQYHTVTRSNGDDERYIDTGVGYSVTDGVIITAQLRK